VLVTGFTIQRLIEKIKNIPYLNAGTNTGDALREARIICEKDCRPFDQGTARSVIVFTDGNSNGGLPVAAEATYLAQTTKMNVFAVAIGTGINDNELHSIASHPSYVLRLHNYLELTQVINNITTKACDFPAFVQPNVKVESEVPLDIYRFYQMDIIINGSPIKGHGAFVEIDIKNKSGRTRVFTSTTDTNPKSREMTMKNRAGNIQTYFEYIEPGTKKFYFSIQGVEPVNQYDFVPNLLDLDGNPII